MTTWQKIQRLFQSRKFWILIAGLVTIAGALATGQIDAWQAVQAAIAALAVYSTGIAIVDAGEAAGANNAPLAKGGWGDSSKPMEQNALGEAVGVNGGCPKRKRTALHKIKKA